MKRRLLSPTRLSFPFAAAVAALLAGLSVPKVTAATLYWDANDGEAGFGDATGTWSVPTLGATMGGWTTDMTGLTVVNGNSVTTTTADVLNFGNAAMGLGAGFIAVNTVSAGDLNFASSSGSIELSGGTINLAAVSTIRANNPANIAHAISCVLAGAGTSLTKNGTGTVILNTANLYTGPTLINGGTNSANFNVITTSGGFNLNGSGTLASTGFTLVNGGTLTLSIPRVSPRGGARSPSTTFPEPISLAKPSGRSPWPADS